MVPTATVPKLIGPEGDSKKPPLTEFPENTATALPVAPLPRLTNISRSSELLPGVTGAENVTLNTQVLPELPEGTTVPTAQVEDGKIVKFEIFVPKAGRDVMVSGPLPRFATVTVWELLVVPSNCSNVSCWNVVVVVVLKEIFPCPTPVP